MTETQQAREMPEKSAARPCRMIGCVSRWLARLALATGFLAALWTNGPAWAQSIADGFAAYQQGDHLGARDIWLPLAEAGDPVAQFNLGKLYEFGGANLRQDYVQSARWYREAAAQRVAAAQNNLGLMHAQGRGVPRDSARAAELWLSAADAGYALAQYNLALAYFRGDGVAQDQSQAARWFETAAEAGLADAQYAMGQMTRLGRVFRRDQRQALAWYQLAAAQGHSDAAAQATRLESEGVVPATPVPSRHVIAQTAPPTPSAKVPEMLPPPGSEPEPEVAEVAEPPAEPEPPVEPEPEMAEVVQPAADPPADEMAEAESSEAAAEATAPPEAAAPAPAAVPPEPAQTAALEPEAPAAAIEEEVSPAPSDTAAEAGAAESYRIWLLSADSEAAANELWREAQVRHQTALASVDMTIHAIDHGDDGTFYRVLAGPLDSRDAAADLCQRLRAEAPSTFCMVVNP